MVPFITQLSFCSSWQAVIMIKYTWYKIWMCIILWRLFTDKMFRTNVCIFWLRIPHGTICIDAFACLYPLLSSFFIHGEHVEGYIFTHSVVVCTPGRNTAFLHLCIIKPLLTFTVEWHLFSFVFTHFGTYSKTSFINQIQVIFTAAGLRIEKVYIENLSQIWLPFCLFLQERNLTIPYIVTTFLQCFHTQKQLSINFKTNLHMRKGLINVDPWTQPIIFVNLTMQLMLIFLTLKLQD